MKAKLCLSLTSVFVVVLGLTACAPAPTIAPSGATAPAADYRNATYQVEGQPVTLLNGVSEVESAPGSATKVITRYFGNEAFGDLNGDGKQDVAFLITQEGGGSGTFFYVVAALATDQDYQGTNAVLLGDRIAPQTTIIENGTIVVNYADRNPGESFTVQPSVGVSKYLKVVEGKLVEVEKP
jgi:hypothetical protein